MRLVTKSYSRRQKKRNISDLVDMAVGSDRRTFRNIGRDRKIMRLRKNGSSRGEIGERFSVSVRTVSRVNETFETHLLEYNSFIATELTKTPVRKPKLAPRYYFNACQRCNTGTMLGQDKPDTNSYELDCLSCGWSVTSTPLKMKREDDWDYAKANRRHYGS